MKKIILKIAAWQFVLFVLFISQRLSSQDLVFETIDDNIASLTEEENVIFNYLRAKENVNSVYFVQISSSLKDAEQVLFNINGTTFGAELLRQDVRSDQDFTWFGDIRENGGIFLYENHGKIASKFSVGEFSYTMVPLHSDLHFLVEFHSTDVGKCGVVHEDFEPDGEGDGHGDHEDDHNDNPCNFRVLIATTPIAREEINTFGFDLPTFAQVAVDEANLAYIESDIDVTMELAFLMETNYTEVFRDTHSTDLNRFRDGTNGLNITHVARDLYRTDVQILFRRNENGIFGLAFTTLNQADAFGTVTVEGVTDGRFSFTHEVGHIQGAFHENFSGTPNFARGFLSSNNNNAWRTIMTRTGAAPCTQPNSCREGVFSNPDLIVQGIAAGAADRDNARRLDETATTVNNFRVTSHDLQLPSEVIFANSVSNHLALQRIDSNNSAVTYQANSQGTMRSEFEIVLRRGVEIRAGSEFRAYIDNPICENLPELRNKQQSANELNLEKLSPTIFPNPTNGQFTIDGLPENTLIELRNIHGNLIFKSWTKLNTIGIDLTAYPAGMYLIRGVYGERNFSEKIIKK